MTSPRPEPEFQLPGVYVYEVEGQHVASGCPACHQPLYFDGYREECVNNACPARVKPLVREGSFIFSLLTYPQRFAYYLLRFGLKDDQDELEFPTAIARLSALYMAGLSLGLSCFHTFDRTFAACFEGLPAGNIQKLSDGRLQRLSLAWGHLESPKKVASQLNTLFLFVLATREHDAFLLHHTGSATPGMDAKVRLTDLSPIDASLYFAEGMLFAKKHKHEAEDLARSDIALLNGAWGRIEAEPDFELVRKNAPLFANEKDLLEMSKHDFQMDGPTLEGSLPYILRLFILYTLHLRWNLSRW